MNIKSCGKTDETKLCQGKHLPVLKLTKSTENLPSCTVAVSRCLDFSGFDWITPIRNDLIPDQICHNNNESKIQCSNGYRWGMANEK